jgi:peptidoglycan/LPS O-acetylase OafA/YrhL
MHRRDSLPALTALRFFAALAVFILHARLLYSAPHWAPMKPGMLHLAVGVSFFFVLSGFILTYNYLDELRRPTARGTWNFYVARWARIYPIHVLGCLALLPATYAKLSAAAPNLRFDVLTGHGFLWHAFYPGLSEKGNALNPPSWSLSAEWYFYLVLPLLIPALTTGSRLRRAAMLGLALSPWLFALAATAKLFAVPEWFTPYRYPPVRAVDFVAGVLLGIYWNRRSTGVTVAINPPSTARATAAELGTLAFCALCVWACVRVTSTPMGAITAAWVGVYIPPFLLLVWVFARGGGLVSKVLAARPLVYLGEISYAFYMLHWAVLTYAIKYGERVGLTMRSFGWRWVICAVATVAVSAACYHLFEIPLRDRLRKLLSFRKPTPDALPATLPFPAATPGEQRAA